MTSPKATDDPYVPLQQLINIRIEQKQDAYLKDWIYWVDEHRKPRMEQLERSPRNTWFLNNYDKLKMADGVLYRVMDTEKDDKNKRPAPRHQRNNQPEEPAKSEGNRDEVSDEESEQELVYWILDQDTQDNSKGNVSVVDLQEKGTLGFTGGLDGTERNDQQGTGLEGDVIPVDNNAAAEPTPLKMARCAFWAYPYFQTPVPEEGYRSLYNGSAALLYRCVYNEYFGIETDSKIEESVSNLSPGCLCEICNVVQGSINCVNGDTIYSPDIFGSMDSFVSSNADTDEHRDEGQYQELESNTFESYFLGSDSETDSLNQS
ncbi:Hypothetical predicted protein [Mytilus galloprovincialis]|uniref:Uncharacterized protein n=1 Tax=Mytilus galloprovincialis TaxID=29158 RepID=A0A8B6BM39_MYTGA|nr:Hypothetical predicted protein [Mytilus galloprovincialis]